MPPIDPPGNYQSIVAAVKALMHRNRVSGRQQSKKLSSILGLGYSQAHRKMTGDADWTINQLQIVAEYFGESLTSIGLGESRAEDARDYTAGTMQEGLFVVGQGQFTFPCMIWIGEPLHTIGKAEFVALRDNEGWRVVEAHQCPENAAKHRVNKLEILFKQAAPTVAIVDDEAGFADNLCEHLNDDGFQATAFYSGLSLERELNNRTFDGYIIDWILGDRTAEALIKQIRSSTDPMVPIFLLTGELNTGRVEESELARVIKQLNVEWREKPIRLATFSAELQKALGT
jgi:CheY-like chemotaxis protein